MALSISKYKKGVPGGGAQKKKQTTFFGVTPNGPSAAKGAPPYDPYANGGDWDMSKQRPLPADTSQPRTLSTGGSPSNGNKGSVSSNNDDATKPANTTVTTPPASVTVPPGATAGQPIDLSGLMPGSASYNEAVRYNQSLTASTTKPPVGPDGPPEPVGDVPPGTTPGKLIIGSVSREGGRGRGSQWAGQEMPAELVNQVPADNMAEFSAAVTKGPMALMSYLTNNIAQPWAKSVLMGLRSNRTRGTANVTRTYEGGSMWDRSPAWMKQRYQQNIQAQEQADWEAQQAQQQQQPQGQQKGQLGQLPPGWAYGFNGQEWVPINTQGGQYSNTQTQSGGMQLGQGPFLQDTEPQDFSNWNSQSGGIVDPRQLQYQQLMQQLPYFAAFLQGGMPQQGG